MQIDRNQEREMELLLNEIPLATSPDYHHRHQRQHHRMHGHGHEGDDGAMNLINGLQYMYISEEPIDPFGLLGLSSPIIPSQSSVFPIDGIVCENLNVGFPPPSIPYVFSPSKTNGFDPYWDSNELNLSILRSPTRSLSPVESFHNLDSFSSNVPKRRGVGSNGGLYGSVYENLMMGSERCIYFLAKDQHGCRFLQRKFDEGRHYVDLIFDGVIGDVGELMKDQFGNYLMQKLFEVCSDEQKTAILLMLTEDPTALVRISLDTHGTRSVQKLIESLKDHQQIALLIAALRPGCLELIKDVNGNHVIQHCLACLSTEDSKFIFDTATKHCVEIATERHGCCVLQRCIGCSSGEYRTKLVAKVSANGLRLARDSFGNYVVQYILGLRFPSANASLASQFKGKYVQLSTQKISSNVVEKCFKEFGEDDKATIVSELLSVPQFEELLQHPFANYVIQSALTYTKGASYAAVVNAIHPHSAILRISPFCKRIYMTLSKKGCVF